METNVAGEIVGKRLNFHFNGYSDIEIKHSDFFKSLLDELGVNNCADLGDHKDFKLSYENTYDLKIDSNLNEKLVEFLFDQDIPRKIQNLTGREYVLGDLVLRKSLQEKSYMSWHRDTYLDKHNNLVGRIPPLIKVIFYPKLEDSTSHELSLLKGSSKRVFKNYIFDKLQRFFFKETRIFQSNNSCIVIDSSIIHSANPSTNKSKGSFRLIYNFCDKSQLETFSSREKINKIYRKYEASY